MDVKEALAIVLELAKQNVLDENMADDDEQYEEMERQQDACDVVEQLASVIQSHPNIEEAINRNW